VITDQAPESGKILSDWLDECIGLLSISDFPILSLPGKQPEVQEMTNQDQFQVLYDDTHGIVLHSELVRAYAYRHVAAQL
jgi:hypothetical protein